MRCAVRLLFVVGLLAAAPFARGQAEVEKAQTRHYLIGLQAADGGFAADGTSPTPTLRATAAAVRALRRLGGDVPNIDAAAKFVLRCRDAATGGFADRPGQSPGVASTATGIMAAVELGVPPDQFRDAAVKYLSDRAVDIEDIRLCAAAFEALKAPTPKATVWLDTVAKSRNKDGTFGEGAGVVRATGGMAALTLRLGGELANREAVVAVLKNGQRPDGGYGKAEKPAESDLDTSYRVVRALIMLKEKPADPARLRAFVAKCRNKDGAYGVAPGQASSGPATYYAATLTHWLAEPRP